MPYGTDIIETRMLGDLICQKARELGARVALLPCIPFGVDSNLMGFPMTISLNPSTLDVIIRDVIVSLETHNIKKVVILNGHGGNSLKHTLREFYGKTSVHISLVNWYEVGKDQYDELFEDVGDHAGEMETSLGLYLFPELIDLSQADDGAVRPPKLYGMKEGWVQITRPFHTVTSNCGVGNPHPGSAEKGKRLVEIIVERVAKYLKELSDAEMDENFPFE
jgi:creatinine amidohydrolase